MSGIARRGYDWDLPTWSDDDAAHRVADVDYNPYADELVFRFVNAVGKVAIVEPLATPDGHYANVMADEVTGEVIGVQIDHLRAAAVKRFPHWRDVASPDPDPAAVDRLVADVRELFDRYAVGGEAWPNGSGG